MKSLSSSLLISASIFLLSSSCSNADEIRINCGGKELLDVTNNIKWMADKYYSRSGTVEADDKPVPLFGSSSKLFGTYRTGSFFSTLFGRTPLSYEIPVSGPGNYDVTMYMVDTGGLINNIFENDFDVLIDGEAIFSDVDLKAINRTSNLPSNIRMLTTTVTVTDAIISIIFDPNGRKSPAIAALTVMTNGIEPTLTASPTTQTVTAPIVAPVFAPATAPITTPVIAPVTAPITTPVIAPVTAPITTPVIAPVTAPIIAPVIAPVTAPTPTVLPPVPVAKPVKPPKNAPIAPPVPGKPVKPPKTAPVVPPVPGAPVKPPKNAPVVPPVPGAPVISPVVPPVPGAPVISPVVPPVPGAPVKPPKNAPVVPPVPGAPVKPPKNAPVAPPVPGAPVNAPVPIPGAAPVKPPKNAPVSTPTPPTVIAPFLAPVRPPSIKGRMRSKHINCGAFKPIDASDKTFWTKDLYFTGGGEVKNVKNNYANTFDQFLYQTERWAEQSKFTYEIPVDVEPGAYKVVFHLAEHVHRNIGERVFSIIMENKLAVCDIDIIKLAGQPLSVTTLPFNVQITDGFLNLSFEPGTAGNPKINAIEIFPIDNTIPLSRLPRTCL